MAKIVVKIPQSIVTLLPRFHEMKEKADNDAERILKRGVQDSFRKRAFRTGNAMRGVETSQIGSFLRRNIIASNPVYYVEFLERGTFKMKARKPMRLGLADVRTELIRNYEQYVKDFAQQT